MILVSTFHSKKIKFGKGEMICPESPTSTWKRVAQFCDYSAQDLSHYINVVSIKGELRVFGKNRGIPNLP